MDDGLKEKISKMSAEEYEAFLKKSELEHTASVGDFVKYLEEHFKLDDKLCWCDCVEGAKYDMTPLKKNDLGKKLFRLVKNEKERSIAEGLSKDSADSFYKYVNDNDVIVI